MLLSFIVLGSWDQQDKTPDQRPIDVKSTEPRQSVVDAVPMILPARRPTAGRLTPRPVDSLPSVDDDDDVASRMSWLRGRSADLDAGSPATVDAIRRMRRRRSRGERTRRRERSLARLSTAGESLSPVEKSQYVDASGNHVTRYRTSPPTQFPQLPRIDHIRPPDDDDVGSLFQVRSSRLGASPTSPKGFIDDEEEVQKIVSSRTSTPGKLRSMLAESGVGSVKTETDEQPEMDETAAIEVTETPTAKRLSYVAPPTDDDIDDDNDDYAEVADVEPQIAGTSTQTSPIMVPRSSLEARTTWTTPFSEPVVRASVDAVVGPVPDSMFVTALSVPPTQRVESAFELQRIRESFSSNSVAAAADLPSQPSSTTSKTALLHRRRAGDAATSDISVQPSLTKHTRRSSVLDVTDVPMQPSLTKQLRRSSVLDVTDVPMQPSSTKQLRRSSTLDVTDVPLKPSITTASVAYRKPSRPSLDDITKQRMRVLGRPPDDGYTPMLQTPLADSEWETVYEEDTAQSSKPYPFYRTPVMRSTLRSSSPEAKKTRRTWARAPPGGWSEHSERRYSVPRLSPPKFIQRPVR